MTGKQPHCELLTGSLAASPDLMDVIFSKWAADLNLPSNRGRGAERGGAREKEREFTLKTQVRERSVTLGASASHLRNIAMIMTWPKWRVNFCNES